MIKAILGLVGTILYPLFGILFLVMDLLQGLFRMFAGIGTMTAADGGSITAGNSGLENDTGIVYYLLNSELIRNLFMSILLLGLFLLIIFTVMAFLKNAYAAKQKPWQEIVGSALKGLGNFIFIPVCCLLGVWLGNILLNAIDGATSTGGAMRMSRKVFICAAYSSNKIRTGELEATKETVVTCVERIESYGDWDKSKFLSQIKEGESQEYYASLVDEAYVNGQAEIWWNWSVERSYELHSINYLVLVVVGIFMLNVLLNLTYGMIKRLFMLLMLYVVSPALCAMYPLDDGNAVGSWKKSFISNTISAYGGVAGMNIFISILPLIENINIISWAGMGISSGPQTSFINTIVQVLVMVSGLYVVKEFIGTLSGWIGADNALTAGESLRKSTQGAIGKTVGGAVSVFSKAAGAAKSGGAGAFFGSLGMQAFSGMSKEFGIDPEKIRKDSKSAFDSSAKDAATRRKDARDAKDLKKKYEDPENADAKSAMDLIKEHKGEFSKTDIDTIFEGIEDKDLRKDLAKAIAAKNARYGLESDPDKILSDSDDRTAKKNAAARAATRTDQAVAGYNKAETEFNDAHAATEAYRTANSGLFTVGADGKAVANSGKTKVDMENLELDIENLRAKRVAGTITAAEETELTTKTNQLKTARQEHAAIAEFERLKQEEEKAADKFVSAAETFKVAVENAAQTEKSASVKSELETMANSIQGVIDGATKPEDIGAAVAAAVNASGTKAKDKLNVEVTVTGGTATGIKTKTS